MFAPFSGHKTLFRHLVEKIDQRIPVAPDIQYGEGLVVIAQRVPAPSLEQFVHGANPAWQGDKGIGEIGHLGFAFVHILDDVQLGDTLMRDFQIFQHLGNDAMNPATLGEHGVGDNPHQTKPATAVDEVNPARCHRLAEQYCRFGIGRVLSGIGAAINCQSLQNIPRSCDTSGRDLLRSIFVSLQKK